MTEEDAVFKVDAIFQIVENKKKVYIYKVFIAEPAR